MSPREWQGDDGHSVYPDDSTDAPQQTKALSLGLQRIQARQPEVIRRAIELRATSGDPVEGLAQVLQGIPVVKDDVWDRIAQEPYG